MFQAIFRRAQVAVESTIDQAVNRTIMAVPFVIAVGFITAALAYRLNREFGPETGNLMMGGLFVVVGFITIAIMSARKPAALVAAEEEAAAAVPPPASAETASSGRSSPISDADRELITAALTSLAPMALPQLLRLVMRNLPLLAALAAGMFVLTRAAAGGSTNEASDTVAT